MSMFILDLSLFILHIARETDSTSPELLVFTTVIFSYSFEFFAISSITALFITSVANIFAFEEEIVFKTGLILKSKNKKSPKMVEIAINKIIFALKTGLRIIAIASHQLKAKNS